MTILIAAPVLSATKSSDSPTNEMCVLNLWQIDSFEGGKGSRASYLQNVANEFAKSASCYVTVTTLSAAAARENLKNGIVPDLISYGAGTFGIETYIQSDIPYYTWCHGGYCILCLDENTDFANITEHNTVINEGTGNYIKITALMCGLEGATYDKPTGAYVNLIKGKYKYLLGTQRDIYRLKTRGVNFSVKPVIEFNDLYQNISVTASDIQQVSKADDFVNYLLRKGEKVAQIGLMVDGIKLHSDEMKAMEGLSYQYKLIAPISTNFKTEIDGAISNNDLKKLKKLFN